MADHYRQAGSTSNFLSVKMRNSTTGNLLSGIISSGVYIYGQRTGKSTQESLGSVVGGTLGTFASNSWVETPVSGIYQYCIPNVTVIIGAPSVDFKFSASGAIDASEHVVLTGQQGGLPAIDDSLITTVLGTPSPTATGFAGASLDGSHDNAYQNCLLVFKGGSANQYSPARKISAYVAATQTLTIGTAFPNIPASGDTFEIIGYVGS
jgi:hypothetical protein